MHYAHEAGLSWDPDAYVESHILIFYAEAYQQEILQAPKAISSKDMAITMLIQFTNSKYSSLLTNVLHEYHHLGGAGSNSKLDQEE